MHRPPLRLLAALALTACSSPSPRVPDAWDLGGQTRASHLGPLVAVGNDGPKRFVDGILAAWSTERAFETCAAVDEHYREPGNDGYNAALDLVEAELRAAGFGRLPGFELRVIEEPMEGPAWTPVSGALDLRVGSTVRSLHRFDSPQSQDRCLLPVHAPSAQVSGKVALTLEEVTPGSILVTDRSLGAVIGDAVQRGAVGVLSSRLQKICVDPTGEERHLDAMAYTSVARGTSIAVGCISPNSRAAILAAGAGAILDFSAEVRWDERPLRTLVAEVVGVQYPEQVVGLVAHVDEPGACDNASGVAGMCELARSIAAGVDRGLFLRPRRSLAFVWGEEYRCSRTYLDDTKRRPIAGLSVDMIGSSRERTGSICLLERSPDPGALVPLPPDEHTPWGAGEVSEHELVPGGLNVIVRAALVDVGLTERGWATAEHPWEGGSDHDVFLERDVPGVLVWHFTDFAYHTSLDRMDHVDAGELRRTSVALGAAAMATADARPDDMKRYLDSLLLERRLRLNMVEEEWAGDELAAQWEAWFLSARHWLRRLCLGLDDGTDILPQAGMK